jgi:hypothetical protein
MTSLLRGEGSTLDRHTHRHTVAFRRASGLSDINRRISPYGDTRPGVARTCAEPYLPTATARQKAQADKPKTSIRRCTFTELLKLTLTFAPSGSTWLPDLSASSLSRIPVLGPMSTELGRVSASPLRRFSARLFSQRLSPGAQRCRSFSALPGKSQACR